MGKVIMSGIVPLLQEPKPPIHVDQVLNNNSWETISQISQAGLAAQYWKAGDTKDIVINGQVGGMTFSNLTVQAFIIGIDHNADVEGQHMIHFQIGKISGNLVGLIDNNYGSYVDTSGAFIMNPSGVSSMGWKDSHMRKTVLGSDAASALNPAANTLLAALPAELRAVMRAATKYSDNHGGGGNNDTYVSATQELLPLLSEFEYFGTRKYANSAEQNHQVQYDYYKAGNSRVHHKHNAVSETAHEWTRSVYATSSGYYCRVYTDGTTDYRAARAAQAIAPCFFV